ncbi:hypothetical protein F5Y15DRAFT_430228 [Xylariaceae sp. FL0016]|nr:hypothetical protein F5Y15DRAFT_430228 [Xylariaceae sp. FL0016]
MQYITAVFSFLSATLTLAAPAPITSRDGSSPLDVAVPTVLKIHNITNNANTADDKTSTVRLGNVETSTLYDIPIPAEASGKTCTLVFKANPGTGDVVSGTMEMDIFRNNFEDLANLTSGNLRDQLLARIIFDAASGSYRFKTEDVTPTIQSFACPAGKTLHWEAVAVGETDQNIIKQDFTAAAADGISVAWS